MAAPRASPFTIMPAGLLGNLPLPDVSAVNEVEPLSDGTLLYSVATYLRPQYFRRYDPKSAQASDTRLTQSSPVKFLDTEVIREYVKSKDGTEIPINIVRRKGTQLNGANPVLLYGYGGFGISETPEFLGATVRLWLDGGGVYVDANLRGGGEYGEDWHQQGALTHKQNVFDDFLAVAEHLIAEKYTDRAHLAILGGSNGGLLMGAALTQRPDLFRAVVSLVGIYDMLRVELDPNGSFNATEYGSVKNPEQFKALYAYSPYHHVRGRHGLSRHFHGDGRYRRSRQSRAFAENDRTPAGGKHFRQAHFAEHQCACRPWHRQRIVDSRESARRHLRLSVRSAGHAAAAKVTAARRTGS